MGGFIAAKRQAKGLTQLELGEIMGITDKAVSKWERDLSCPDIATIPKLAEVLGVSVEELMRVSKADAGENPKKGIGAKHAVPFGAIEVPFKAIALAMGVAVAVLAALEKIDAKSAFIMLGIGLALLGITSLGEDN